MLPDAAQQVYMRGPTFYSHVESTCMHVSSLKGQVWAHKTNYLPQRLWSAWAKTGEWVFMYMCVNGNDLIYISTISD